MDFNFYIHRSIRMSGRWDSNPRPWRESRHALTGLFSFNILQVPACSTGFYLQFLRHSLRACPKSFKMYQLPRNSISCGNGLPFVVPPQTFLKFVCATRIISVCLFALNNISKVRHLSGRWDSNPRPLGPEPSALAGLSHAPYRN